MQIIEGLSVTEM